MGTGQTPVKAYNRYLCELIHKGRAHPSFIVSHELPLEDAPGAYEHFDRRDMGWTKVVLSRKQWPRQPTERIARRTTHAQTRARPERGQAADTTARV